MFETPFFGAIYNSCSVKHCDFPHIILLKSRYLQHTKEGVYGAVCEYAIDCVSVAAWPLPFPPCVHTSWGPGDSAIRYGLVALQKGSVFLTENGIAEVRFRAPRELRFIAKLKAVDIGNSAARVLNGCAVCRAVGDVTTFTVRYVDHTRDKRLSVIYTVPMGSSPYKYVQWI